MAALLMLALAPRADASHADTVIGHPAPGSIGAGFSIRHGNDIYRNVSDIASNESGLRSDLLPLFLYEGKRVFARGALAGVHLQQRPGVAVDLVARYRFDRLEPSRDPFFAGMQERRQTLDGGLSLAVSGRLGEVSLLALTDLLGRHRGEEFDLSYRYPAGTDDWQLSPYVSLLYQSADLTDYYYGVRANEAAPGRPAYQADAAAFWRYGLDASYRLSRGWHAHGGVSVEQVPDTVRDSPLTEEAWRLRAYGGVRYYFPSVSDSTAIDPEREAVWSWRVNAGYTAEADFWMILGGALRGSEDVDTNLAGFTIGRLLDERGAVEYWGRFSINRRFERGNQDDFFEFVGYGMALARFHSPWSQREWFRYGIGFGVSYGEQVPWIEKVKQRRRERPTSRTLIYLEGQLDFPLRNLFGAGALQHCYAGLSLVHRSGAFGTADLLGNVAGGSNVVTGHLECGF
ncbi:MAG: MipA/OmpV family protein [Pseudomonadales bacterium]